MSGTTTTTYTYDAIGKRTAIQSDWVANELTTWDFDADGRVVRVFDPIKRAIETQYDRRGLKTTITYDSGRTQSNAYDSDSRNTGIRNVIAGNDVQRFTYTFDANGNRIGTVDLNGSVTTYTLDANDRLTEDLTVGTDAHTFTYTYDSRGNLLTTSETGVVVAHAYDAASRLVTSTAGGVVTTYTFDVNGNMVSANAGGTVTSNTYDRENRLTATDTIGVSDGVFSFGGDFHRKREREVELYYLDDLIIGEGQGGALTKLYLQLGGQLVGEVLDIGDSAQPRYYLADFLGSVTGQTNPGNDLEFERRMTPFGNLLSGQPFIDNGANWVGAHGYRYGNHPFAQVYVWHRVYALQTSQWTTRDLLWPEEMGYGYVGGNPVTLTDPSGLLPIGCVAACAGAAACAIDLWIVCKDWDSEGFTSFQDCWDGVWDELPGVVQTACSLGLDVCFDCLLGAAGKILRRPPGALPPQSPPQIPAKRPTSPPRMGGQHCKGNRPGNSKLSPCQAAMQARDTICGRPDRPSPKYTCQNGCGRPKHPGDPTYCGCLRDRWTQGGLCMASIREVTRRCYSGKWDKPHWKRLSEARQVVALCVEKMKKSSCPPFSGR